jgi:hypothetical protein
MQDILSRPAGVQAAGRWLLACGLLTHLQLAQQIHVENLDGYIPLPELR